MTKLPKIRLSDVVVQTLDKELLVYDLKTHQAYQLNETSMIVFEACAAGQTFEDLKRKYKFTDDLIALALDSFQSMNLLDSGYQTKFAAVSRREMIKKVGLASAVALPVIVSIVAPQAAQAASCTAAGQPVSTTTTNPTGDTTQNQNYAGQFLLAKCCNHSYENFISNGCSFGVGERCDARATCT